MSISIKDARERAMYLCSRSEKSLSDIMEKLKHWGLESESDRQKILSELLENDFINEERYCRAYVRDKHMFNRWGRIKLRTMLRAKRISNSIIEEALDELDKDKYYEILKYELGRKRKSLKASNLYDLKAKLLRFGASKGYEPDLIFKAIDELK
ncbi:MAG: regulatory protein RecX [Marinilabiliaceae bacterium]|jgi:regulatory protein|nr:regulatory protein RecX [Marinilabiliaceae bacterium]